MPFGAEPLVLTEEGAVVGDGVAYQKIQDLLDTTAPTIARWKHRFLQHRITGLMEE